MTPTRAPAPGQAETEDGRSARLAAIVFGAFVVVGAWAILAHLGRYYWFNGDEWAFLSDRDGGDVGDLFRAHNEHLVPLPIIAYRLLWNAFGLRSYLPYQVPVVVLHLTTAVLLRAVMRRAGVHPWIATAAASVFVLFGPGEENIVWAFQMGFTGGLVFGLAHLLVADHAGSFGLRDWIGLGFGILAISSTGVGPIMTVVVGAVVLVRRSWRPAAFHTVPLGLAYLYWWVAAGPERISDPYGRSTDWLEVLGFVRAGVAATFEGLAGNAVVGLLLGVVLVVGLVVAWAPLGAEERRRAAVMPFSLLLAGLAFLFISGYGRWWIGPEVGSSSRYVHLAAALSLPALAVAVDALVRRWRPTIAVPIAALVLVSAIPQNIGDFESHPLFRQPYFESRRELVAALARSEHIGVVPRSTRPDALNSPMTAGWLLDALEDGHLPDLDDPDAVSDPTLRLRFGLAQIRAMAPSGDCEEIRQAVDLRLHKGDEFGVAVGPWSRPRDGWFYGQAFTVQLLEDGQAVGSRLLLHPDGGNLLRAELDDLDVRLGLAPQTEAFILCR